MGLEILLTEFHNELIVLDCFTMSFTDSLLVISECLIASSRHSSLIMATQSPSASSKVNSTLPTTSMSFLRLGLHRKRRIVLFGYTTITKEKSMSAKSKIDYGREAQNLLLNEISGTSTRPGTQGDPFISGGRKVDARLSKV